MPERDEQIRQALRTVDPEWSSADTDYGLAMLRIRLRRRAAARWAGLAAAAMLLGVWLAWPHVGPRFRPSADAQDAAFDPRLPVTRFSDGSTVTRLQPNAAVSVVEAGPERI